jgi:hypothetical protein
MDIDHVGNEDFRVVQLTPPASECSIIIGNGITSAAPGSLEGRQLVASDIEAARDELVGRGVEVGEIFHDPGGTFYHLDPDWREPGPDLERGDYGSLATFSDPDDNGLGAPGGDAAGPRTVTGTQPLRREGRTPEEASRDGAAYMEGVLAEQGSGA